LRWCSRQGGAIFCARAIQHAGGHFGAARPRRHNSLRQGNWLYARGVALAARGDFTGAAAAADAIDTLDRTADFKLLKESNVPVQDVLRIARTLVLARIAQARGVTRTAIVRFERAAALQDALPYTEPPYWYYPIRQSLAAALLQAGRYAEAERQFQRALARAPANGWSYYGLAQLHKARGNAAAARKAEADLAEHGSATAGFADFQSLKPCDELPYRFASAISPSVT
jgi:tetratricopeptide (TPR) repeat protein